jgi:hypothetical protein
MYGYWHRRCIVNLYPITRLVRYLHVHTSLAMIVLTNRTQVLDLDRCVQKMATTGKRSRSSLGSDQEKTFGPTITGLIHQHIGPERLLLWDSKLRGGRPDLMKIVKETYHTWGAEGDIVHSGALCTASLTCNYPLQLSSSRRITLVIQSSCRAAKKQAFPHSAHCGIL